MKKMFAIDSEINKRLKSLKHPHDKIDFLIDYLKNNHGIPLHTLAFIYESLGDYYRQISHKKPTFYKKAGSTWEVVSTLKEYHSNNVLRKIALMNAYRNYKKSYILQKKSKSHSRIAKENMKNVKLELHKYGGPIKKISLVIIFSMFLLSLLSIVSTPTGLVTSEIESERVTIVGIAIGVLSIIAMFFVIWKYK